MCFIYQVWNHQQLSESSVIGKLIQSYREELVALHDSQVLNEFTQVTIREYSNWNAATWSTHN